MSRLDEDVDPSLTVNDALDEGSAPSEPGPPDGSASRDEAPHAALDKQTTSLSDEPAPGGSVDRDGPLAAAQDPLTLDEPPPRPARAATDQQSPDSSGELSPSREPLTAYEQSPTGDLSGTPAEQSPTPKARRQPKSRASPRSGRGKRAPLFVCVKVGDPKGTEATSEDSEWRTTVEVRPGGTPQTASSPFPDKPLVFEIPGDARESGALVFTLFEVVGDSETQVARGKFPLASPPYRGLFALRRGPESPARTQFPITAVTWWEHRQEELASRISLEIDVQVLPHRPQKKPRSSQERVNDRIKMARDNPNRILAQARKRAEKTYERMLASCDFIRTFQARKDLADVSELRKKIRKLEQQIESTDQEIEQLEQEIPTLEAEGHAGE